MHSLDFSPQIPARRMAEPDEQTMTVWTEATWSEVKAPGRPAGAGSAPRTKRVSPVGRPEAEPGDGAGPHRP
ncbi:hypothetical protein [Streptomyces sp. NPDC002588]|uniref:hypothetical protein n=1 Tax=Streptomyces sp. NPDC002588 TaxID=3154419 RepID=UPI0033291394